MRSQIGRIFMVGIQGLELDAPTRRLLRTYSIGGVVLFRRNVHDVPTLVRLTSDLHALDRERPLLIASDHEGGRVTRFDLDPFTRFPPAAIVGRAGSPHLAYRAGVAMGEELRAVGIDLDFAPVLDVDSNPKNPVIGDRSFAPHPRTVARMAVSVVHGLQHAGVLSCGKHFPGHGDTDLDSHLDLPAVRRSIGDLERTEFLPFRRAVAEGIDALMTAHVVYSALDPVRPATLSRRIATDLLRTRMHFRGVVFTDDLDMKAISDRHEPDDAAIRAIEAGADVVLFCNHPDKAIAAFEGVERAAARRSRLRERIEESVGRLDALLRTHARRLRRPGPTMPPDGFEKHRNVVEWIRERAERAHAEGRV
jgi:beta-N-acetylhexosaminidase